MVDVSLWLQTVSVCINKNKKRYKEASDAYVNE